MVFKVPPPAGKLKKNRFEFDLDGETQSVPKLEFLSAESEDLLKSDDTVRLMKTEYIMRLIEAESPEAGAKVRAARLSRDQLDALYQAWSDSSRVTTGESSHSEN
ncbi:MAG: hypothetical protein ACRDXB_04865 [Actinomycetes bacterium]